MDNTHNNLHPFAPQGHIFRAYDIRGDYRLFTHDFVESLAHSFTHAFSPKTTQTAPKKTIVIGYDMRHGSQGIAQQLANVFIKAKFDVLWLGLVTTPMMAFWTHQQDKGQQNGLIVTASHSAKNMTGIKWIVDGETPASQDIKELYQDMINYPIQLVSKTTLAKRWQVTKDKIAVIKNPEIAYQQHISQAIDTILPTKSSHTTATPLIDCLVVDCLHGATSGIAQSIFSQYARKVVLLNDTADGNFPKGNPDPSEANRLTELQSSIIEHKADLGVAFDGDGDRLVVLDNHGELINPDHLLYLLAQTAISGQKSIEKQHGITSPASKLQHEVIFDVKCFHQLPKMLSQLGTIPVMSKTGSNHMRYNMQRSSNPTLFAGELSGHFIFNDGLFIAHDDGIYAGIRLMAWLSEQAQPLSQIVATLPSMISTADIYIPVNERQSLMSRLINILKSWLQAGSQKLSLPSKPSTLSNQLNNLTGLSGSLSKDVTLSTIDGIRLDFDNGFGVIRQSNTSQSLTVRFAADTLADFKKIQQQFVKICQQLDEQLAKAIANIQPLNC